MVNASLLTNPWSYAYSEQRKAFNPRSKPDPEATHSSRTTAYVKKAWNFGLLTNTSLWYDSQAQGHIFFYTALICVLQMCIRLTTEVCHTIILSRG